MKANFENFKKALELCAEAHKANFHDWTDEDQLGIESDTTPVISDVRMIVDAFVKPEMVDTCVEYGFITIFLYADMLKDDVDEAALGLALPYGWFEKIQ